MTGRLILLRHGQTFSNLNRVLDARPPGAELTELGQQQAVDVGHELAEYCGPGNVERIVTSVAIRAQQTAMRVAASIEEDFSMAPGSLPIDIRLGIHEISAGTLQGTQGEEAAQQYTDAFRGWLDGDEDSMLPEGENHRDVLHRYQPVLESLVGADKDTIVVSHGAAIRVVSTHASGIDPDFAFGAYLANCRFVVLRPEGKPFGQWTIERWAESAVQI
ncbi:histidine phosphatase family protein [Corynebacterium sp. H130]|uniref:histidine phosphatase family protein n=1 Tax=Corynebacterium sp. H130 TaxID=3133444 RepID=UPI0030B17351